MRLVPGRDVRVADGDGEGRRAHDAAVLEIHEEPVVAGAGERGLESDCGIGGLRCRRVVVQVGQVTGAQRHQVCVGAEVGLQVGDDAAAVPDGRRHGGGRLRTRVGVQRDGVVVDRRDVGRRGHRLRVELAADEDVGAQRECLCAGGFDVGEHAVGPGAAQVGVHRPGARGVPHGVQVLVGREISAHHDQVQFLLVLHGVVGDRRPVETEHPEPQRRCRRRRHPGVVEHQPVAVLLGGQAAELRADRGGMVVVRLVGGAPVGAHERADSDRGGEDRDHREGEQRELATVGHRAPIV